MPHQETGQSGMLAAHPSQEPPAVGRKMAGPRPIRQNSSSSVKERSAVPELIVSTDKKTRPGQCGGKVLITLHMLLHPVHQHQHRTPGGCQATASIGTSPK